MPLANDGLIPSIISSASHLKRKARASFNAGVTEVVILNLIVVSIILDYHLVAGLRMQRGAMGAQAIHPR